MSKMLNKNELIEVLELLFNRMQENGMLPPTIENKQALIEEVANQIDSNFEIEKQALRNPAIQKSLSLCILSAAIAGKNPNFKFDYVSLFQEKNNPDEMKKELTAQLVILFTEANKLNPKNQFTPKAILALAEVVALELTNQFMKEDQHCPAENNDIVDVLAETFTSSLRSLFGGIDPRVAGGQIMPVLTIIGNLTGIVNLSSGHATSNAFMDEQNRFNGHADPLGIENSVRIRLGAITHQLETALDQLGVLAHSNWPPIPHPNHH